MSSNIADAKSLFFCELGCIYDSELKPLSPKVIEKDLNFKNKTMSFLVEGQDAFKIIYLTMSDPRFVLKYGEEKSSANKYFYTFNKFWLNKLQRKEAAFSSLPNFKLNLGFLQNEVRSSAPLNLIARLLYSTFLPHVGEYEVSKLDTTLNLEAFSCYLNTEAKDLDSEYFCLLTTVRPLETMKDFEKKTFSHEAKIYLGNYDSKDTEELFGGFSPVKYEFKSSYEEKFLAAIEYLLKIPKKDEGKHYNALYQSRLNIEAYRVRNKHLDLWLAGNVITAGIGDQFRIIGQIQKTLEENSRSEFKSFNVYINGIPIEVFFSEKEIPFFKLRPHSQMDPPRGYYVGDPSLEKG